MIGGCAGITKVVDMVALDKALKERFGKKYVASGGTATLDEAIKKKYAKKEQLLQKNLDTMQRAFDISSEMGRVFYLCSGDLLVRFFLVFPRARLVTR